MQFDVADKLNGCLSTFRVASDAGEVMWEIEGDLPSSPCVNNFPLVYGEVPQGLKTKVAAKPLRPGILYKLAGYDGDRYYGAFTYRHAIAVTNTPEVMRATSAE
jgi:hypothetical protein